jgi:hypothetical protein
MVRAWKNSHGVSMSGMLIDTLVYSFFGQHQEFNSVAYASYDQLFATFFAYLGGLDHQEYWAAPGSGQRVHATDKFQTKAKKRPQRNARKPWMKNPRPRRPSCGAKSLADCSRWRKRNSRKHWQLNRSMPRAQQVSSLLRIYIRWIASFLRHV